MEVYTLAETVGARSKNPAARLPTRTCSHRENPPRDQLLRIACGCCRANPAVSILSAANLQ